MKPSSSSSSRPTGRGTTNVAMLQSISHGTRNRPPGRRLTEDDNHDGTQQPHRVPSKRKIIEPQQAKAPELQPPSGVARGGPQPRFYENDEDLARRHQEYYDEEDRKIRASRRVLGAPASSQAVVAQDLGRNEYAAAPRDVVNRDEYAVAGPRDYTRDVYAAAAPREYTRDDFAAAAPREYTRDDYAAAAAPRDYAQDIIYNPRDSHEQQQQQDSYYPREARVAGQVPVATLSSSNVARAPVTAGQEDYHGYDDGYYQDQDPYTEDRKLKARSKPQYDDDIPRDIPASAAGNGDYYRRGDSKKTKKKKKKDKDLVTLGQFSAQEEEKQELDLRPGAVRIPGAQPGFHQDQVSYVTGNTSGAQLSPPPVHGTSPTNNNLVHAFLVNEEEERRAREEELQQRLRRSQQQNQQHQQRQEPLRVDAKAVEYKPWYRRKSVLIALGLIVCAGLGVGLGVGLTREDGDVIVEDFPTVSPAPTALAEITVVVQLDEKPAETGWSLECDNELVQAVPQGSYAFLPIGLLIPSYRLEISAVVVLGSQCVYTITDAGNDGLQGGFFELFFGNDVGNAANRIQGGVPLSATQAISFEAFPPMEMGGPPTPSEPTGAPPPLPPPIQGCTVCPDGSAVPNRSTSLENSTMNCGELDDFAREVLNSTQCLEIQLRATDCGCVNFCNTLCPDGTLVDSSVENTPVQFENGRPITCRDLQNQVILRNSSASDCLSANFLGEEVCDCPPTGNFCRICQGGAVPANLTKEIIPGVACGDISGIAYSILRSNPDFAFLCPACLSIGEYCGCPPPPENPRVFCRLCGDKLLPDTDRLVFSPLLKMNTTCFHIEFHSNLGVMPNGTTTVIPDCSVVQEQSAAECCRD